MKRSLGLTLLFSLVALAGTPQLFKQPQPLLATTTQEQLIAVHGYGGSGEELIQRCSAVTRMSPDHRVNQEDAPALSFCLGFISGVVDIRAIAVAGGAQKGPYCIPESGVTSYQLARIVLKYGNDHPEELHYAAALLVFNALSKAFPC